jgi:hypothetical protein
MDINTAQRLAYYSAYYDPKNTGGVLAPRGWHCFGIYGSNGATLFVTPQPIQSRDLLSDTWAGIGGPAIQVSVSIGDTSGRFDVARVITRVFPAQRAFVQRVINEGDEPASDFPSGPYPKDKLTSRSGKVVEF